MAGTKQWKMVSAQAQNMHIGGGNVYENHVWDGKRKTES